MARDLSSNIDASIASVDTRTHDIMEITLPAQNPLDDPTVFYLATGELTIGPNTYLPAIRSLPSIKYSRGESAADGGEFTIENYSRVFGVLFLNQARPLDGSAVVIKRAFRVSPASITPVWETDEIGRGMMRVSRVKDDVIAATFISDLSDPTAVIGGESLTQRCIHVFNQGGLTPTDITAACGWLLAQGGDPDFCDHVLDSATGCTGHNNRHRCGCVPPLAVTTAIISGSTGSGSGPGGSGGGPGDGNDGGYGNGLLRKLDWLPLS